MTSATPATTPSTYVIFGATGGIGSALARRLVASGATVHLAARDAARLTALADELQTSFSTVDATNFADVDRVVDEVRAQHERIDGMANCVGSLLLKPAHLTKAEEFQATIATNLTTAFAVVRAAGRVMTNGGSVVMCSSAAARTGLANHDAIAAAKGGILGLTLSAAATYASRGLRVNAVAPGLVQTPLTSRITNSASAADASRAMHALGRLGTPDDVAGLMAWLLGPDATWVTGQCYGVDGGLGTVRSR